MYNRTSFGHLLVLLSLTLSAAACASADMGEGAEPGRDVTTDGTVENDVPLLGDGTETDAGSDAGQPDAADAGDDGGTPDASDAVADVGEDVSADVQPDGQVDAEPDAPTDTNPDQDVLPDASTDAETDVTADADADAGTDVQPDAEPDATPDAEPDVAPDVIEPVCGDGNVDEGEECDDGNDIDDDECNTFCEARGAGSCEPCTSDDECGFGADLCVTLSDGDFCATSCEGGCADGETCAEVGEEGALQCVPDAGWCESCPDDDRDTVCDEDDVCAGGDDRTDRDGDGIPDGCDLCPDDNPNDSDGDSVCDGVDVCPGFDDRVDNNENGTPDGCDPTNELFCDNGVDDDNDGSADCDDDDCAAACLVTACDSPTLVTGPGVYTGSTVDGPATLSGSCGVDGRSPEVVIAFTAPTAGAWCVDTFASDFDTRLSVRTTCDDASSELVCTDDTGALRQSEAELTLAAAQTVYVVVEGYDGAAGDYALQVLEGPCPVPTEVCDNGLDDDGDEDVDCLDADCAGSSACAELVCDDGADNDDDGSTDCADADCVGTPACLEVCDDGVDNDSNGDVDCADSACVGTPSCLEVCTDGVDNDLDGRTDCADTEDCADDPVCDVVADGTCAAPFPVIGLGEQFGDTTGATNDAVGSCQSNNSTDHVWIFQPPAAGTYCAETVGTAFDTVLYARTSCADAATETACNDDAVALQSQINLTLDGVEPVYLWMDGYSTNVGPYTLNVRSGPCNAIVGACDDVAVIGEETITGTTVGSTLDIPLSCGADGAGPARIYTFTPAASGPFCVETNGSTFDTRLGILSACDGVELLCDDDAGISTQSALGFDGVAGAATTIVVEGYAANEGDFTLTVTAGICPEFL